MVDVQPHSSSYTNLRIGPWIHCPKGPKANYVFCHSTYATLCQSYTSYTCGMEKAYANAMLAAGANSTLGKWAQFPLLCQSALTISLDNILLYWKVLLIHNGSCHMQANVLQASKTLCMLQFSHACIPTPAMSHMCQHCDMQNYFNN